MGIINIVVTFGSSVALSAVLVGVFKSNKALWWSNFTQNVTLIFTARHDIITGCWKSYNNLALSLQVYGYLTVTHYLIVNPGTEAHTQPIKSLWQKVKFQTKGRAKLI